jgi:cystathionine beta-lyase
MISDEIHSDLVNPGHSHSVLAGISPETAAATITLAAPSKTFNLAGMATASVIISNESLMRKYKKVVEALHVDLGNLFGNVAAEAAYTHGDEWLDQLLQYIDGNINYLSEFCMEHIKNINVIPPEATYMAWLDFRETGLSGDALRDFMIKTAGLGLNEGRQFGPGGDGFMRINLACPRSVLQHALENLKKAMDTLQ